MTNHQVILKLRRLNTLLVLAHRSNNLALATRRAIEEIESWPQNAPFADAFEKKAPRIVFAGYGPKFIKIINELLETNSIAMIDQLQPDYSLFFCELCELPGIGETGARRIFYDKFIENIDDLRVACANKVLKTIPGFGEQRILAIEAWIDAKNHDDSIASCDVVVKNIAPINDFDDDNSIDPLLQTALAKVAPAPSDDVPSRKHQVASQPFADFDLDEDIKADLAKVRVNSPGDASHDGAVHAFASFGSDAAAIADYTLTHYLPPAFIARFIMAADLFDHTLSKRVLMLGTACVPLCDCIARLVDHTRLVFADHDQNALERTRTMAQTAEILQLNDFEDLDAYDVVLVDPVRYGILTQDQRESLLQHVNHDGRLVMASLKAHEFAPIQLVDMLRSRHLLPDENTWDDAQVESVEYMKIIAFKK